jgi:DNA-binding response OmpR family regulator
MAKILIVEDDQLLAQIIEDEMRTERHQSEHASDGSEALEKLRCYAYDLVVLDWNLPSIPGLDVLLEMRSAGKTTPVLMLTGKTKLQEKETGLDAGADDYLTKPFEIRELAARVRALLRRADQRTSNILNVGNLLLDPATHTVRRNGEDVLLSPKEFALLEFFMRNKNTVFSTEALISRVWKSDADVSNVAVRAELKRLRDKIDVAGQPSVIRTIFGVGYKLEG